jgi:hypothetical protein
MAKHREFNMKIKLAEGKSLRKRWEGFRTKMLDFQGNNTLQP